jgi:hypothetical protein
MERILEVMKELGAHAKTQRREEKPEERCAEWIGQLVHFTRMLCDFATLRHCESSFRFLDGAE